MKKTLIRVFSLVLIASMLLSCISIPASAAEYRVAYGNGPSASYKSGKYYQNFLKVPLTGDGRTDVLALALSQMGYHEGASTSDMSGSSSSNGNYTEYNWNAGNAWTGGYTYEWCATFCSWAIYQAKQTNLGGSYKDLCRYHVGDPAYVWREIGCGHWVNNLKSAGYWKYSKYHGGSYTPQPGDLIFFRSAAHIGLVVYADSTYVYTIEGNTSDAQGLEPAGGGVFFKSYALNSSLLDGYGVLPYTTNASAAKVDYSGANPTAGLWMTNALKYIYTDAACTVDSGKRVPRFTMVEATAVAANKKAIKITYNGTTGYLALNSDRVVQISSTASTVDPELQAAKDKLQTLVNTVSGITYKDYTDDRLATLRTQFASAQNVLYSETSTTAQCNSAYTALNNAYNDKSPNPVQNGVYINGVNAAVTNGRAMIFTPSFGTINTGNACHSWSANIRVRWDDRYNSYIAQSVETGIGAETPDVNLAANELFIAVHNWETGVSADDSPVVGSEANYFNAWIPEFGGYKVKFNGIDLTNGVADIGAYIYFEKCDPSVSTDGNIVYGKSYTTSGLYAENGSVLWPDENGTSLTNGFVPADDAGYDDPEFAGFNVYSEEYINNGYAAVTVNLGANYAINKMTAYVASRYNSPAGIFAPDTIEFYVSNDGSTWNKAGQVAPTDNGDVSNLAVTLELSSPVYGKYIQYRIKSSNSWMFVSEVAAYGTESAYEAPSTGDLNENDEIDTMDYIMLKRVYFASYTIGSDNVADVNGNGTVDTMDYIMLKRVYFGTYVMG